MPPHWNLVLVLSFCSLSELKGKKIAVGAARRISHLHENGVIHWDIKPHKILLGKNFEAHIGNFRMVMFIDTDEEKGVSQETSIFSLSFLSTQIGGTEGCLDPEYSKR
ncbi:hypothetical protein NL676_016998 [Syzygium grande]|nr:hypothetical protein NL676_016998 [Syzygium grande]